MFESFLSWLFVMVVIFRPPMIWFFVAMAIYVEATMVVDRRLGYRHPGISGYFRTFRENFARQRLAGWREAFRVADWPEPRAKPSWLLMNLVTYSGAAAFMVLLVLEILENLEGFTPPPQ